MSRIGLALRVLFNGQFADQVSQLAAATPAIEEQKAEPVPPPPEPSRSEALTLLEALQREARLIDFLKEPVDAYQDAQIGAAVRNIHRDSGEVLERMFGLRPVINQVEGSQVELSDSSAASVRLIGNVTNERPSSGQLVHHGWIASRCDMPDWVGSDDAANVVAAAEVEIK